MNETIAATPDLNRLSERIEKAASAFQQLRAERDRLQEEQAGLARRLRELESRLQGQDPAALIGELQSLRRERKEWQVERREIAGRIESLLRKLDKLGD